MDASRIKREIVESAKEIERLRARVHEAAKHRDDSERAREAWEAAARDFHGRYMQLGFPGGLDNIEARVLAGEPFAVEAALCFLEVRPYFFRSGYMFQSLLKKMKRSPLNQAQQRRLQVVVDGQAAWRKIKEEKRQHEA